MLSVALQLAWLALLVEGRGSHSGSGTSDRRAAKQADKEWTSQKGILLLVFIIVLLILVPVVAFCWEAYNDPTTPILAGLLWTRAKELVGYQPGDADYDLRNTLDAARRRREAQLKREEDARRKEEEASGTKSIQSVLLDRSDAIQPAGPGATAPSAESYTDVDGGNPTTKAAALAQQLQQPPPGRLSMPPAGPQPGSQQYQGSIMRRR